MSTEQQTQILGNIESIAYANNKLLKSIAASLNVICYVLIAVVAMKVLGFVFGAVIAMLDVGG